MIAIRCSYLASAKTGNRGIDRKIIRGDCLIKVPPPKVIYERSPLQAFNYDSMVSISVLWVVSCCLVRVVRTDQIKPKTKSPFGLQQ